MIVPIYLPAVLVVAAILFLDNIDHLLNFIGKSMEILAHPFLGKDVARLDEMLVVDMMDMLIRMNMLVLMLVMVVVLVRTIVMISIVLVVVVAINVLGAAGDSYANGGRDCAKRNQRKGKSHCERLRNGNLM